MKKWLKIVLIVVAVIIILGAIGGIVAFRATSAPVQTAQSFLKDLSIGDVNSAYSLMSTNLSAAGTASDLQSFLKENSVVVNMTSVSFSDRSVNSDGGISHAVLHGTITASAGLSSPVTVKEVQENGQWKIDEFTLATD